jgi:hypothetical protein
MVILEFAIALPKIGVTSVVVGHRVVLGLEYYSPSWRAYLVTYYHLSFLNHFQCVRILAVGLTRLLNLPLVIFL